jgi:hypothetical protein
MLQQRCKQLSGDLNNRQHEYEDMIASLTKSFEEQIERQVAHVTLVMEQRATEAMVSNASVSTLVV